MFRHYLPPVEHAVRTLPLFHPIGKRQQSVTEECEDQQPNDRKRKNVRLRSDIKVSQQLPEGRASHETCNINAQWLAAKIRCQAIKDSGGKEQR